MKEFMVAGLITAAGSLVLLALMGILGALFGGIAGFFFEWIFFDSYVVFFHLMVKLGVPAEATPFEVGAALGFLGGFFRSRQNSHNEPK